MDLSPTIKVVQRAVGVDADGVAGALTWAAIAKAVGAIAEVPSSIAFPVEVAGSLDPRSEGIISQLNSAAQPLMRQFILALVAAGIDAKAISGFRTYEEQEQLYKKYKVGGNVAAPPGYSNHNFGLAIDIGIFQDGKYLEESPLYERAGQIGKELGLIWGGTWENEDQPHFEYRPDWALGMSENQALAEYRDRLKKGENVA